MNRIKYWLLIIWLSLKWIFRITLGDEIIYKNKKYIVANGVCPTTWRLANFNPDYYKSSVPRKDCIKVWSIKGIIRSFQSGYSFYMGYWYNIWVMSGITSWMKACRIW